MLLSRPLISAFQFQERNTINVQGWILKFKMCDFLYFSSDSSASDSQEAVAAFVPQGRVLLHRLLQLEEASAATLGADEGRSSFCLRKSVKCNAVYLFIHSVLIVLSVSVYRIWVCWSCSLEKLFPVKWPGSTCLYRLMSLAKYWGFSSFRRYWILASTGFFVNLPNFYPIKTLRYDPTGSDKQKKTDAGMLT